MADAGLACELRGQIWVAMNGLSGVSENVRQLLTSINNDLTEDVLQLWAAELSDPIRRHSSIPIQCRQRADQIKTVFNENSMDLRSVLALVEDATSENDINNMPSP